MELLDGKHGIGKGYRRSEGIKHRDELNVGKEVDCLGINRNGKKK
jgi:hypothetical protein